jgi:YVTN family beta-propeller protein
VKSQGSITSRRLIAATTLVLAWLVRAGPAVAQGGSGFAYLTNVLSDNVSVIDIERATPTYNALIANLPVGTHPFGVAVSPDGSKVYVTNAGGTVSVIATETNTVFVTINVDKLQAKEAGPRQQTLCAGARSI